MDKNNTTLDNTYYAISEMDINHLYGVLCKELSFEKMIKLYKLINYKIHYLEDEPVMTTGLYQIVEESE